MIILVQGRPFQCVQCPAAFCRKPYLDIHMRCHTGEKPFECNVCMKRFTQRSTLNIHKRIHSGRCNHSISFFIILSNSNEAKNISKEKNTIAIKNWDAFFDQLKLGVFKIFRFYFRFWHLKFYHKDHTTIQFIYM